MGRRALLALLLPLAACAARPPVEGPAEEPRPPVEARAEVDRAVATTGDLITYRIEVDHDAGVEVRLPEAGAQIAGFRIVDVGAEPERRSGGRVVLARWYRLRADLVGSYVLPPVRVAWVPAGGDPESPELVETSAIFVEVASVLPEDGAAEDIRDIKPPRRVAPVLPWTWIAAAALGLAAAAGALWWWWQRRGSGAVEPEIPAHELAFAELDRLRGTDFDDPAAVRRFHFAISETVRAYVERRFGLNATDLTTEEIVAGLDGVAQLGRDERVALERFLAETDLVKFAHREPTREEIVATYERALGFVEATRPRPAAQEGEAAEEREAA